MKMHRNFLTAIVTSVLIAVFWAPISLAANMSFVVLGDVHYDKLEFHDLDWVKTKWVNPDDYRQITQEYTVFTARNWDKLMKAVGRRIEQDNPPVRGILQLGDLMEGIAGSPELAKKMEYGTIRALKEPNFPVPWILVKGNHDGRYGPGEAEAYHQILIPFRNKQLDINTPSISFRYRVGDVEFFCPDSEAKFDELADFLEKGLTESNAKFKFVALHIPVIPVTGRCWDVFGIKDMKARAERQQRLLGIIAKNRAIVLCGHLHRYCVVRRQTPQGPVVQAMVISVIRDSNSPGPYWYTKDFGPELVDRESNFAPNTQERRREILKQEAKYITDFRLADLPGYALLTIKDDRVILKMYRGVSDTMQEQVDLTQMLQKAPTETEMKTF
jgi:3',5'-cyclic AMP phosphodiesterase CpdA